MKVSYYLLLFAFTLVNPLQAQIFSGPNKSVEGLRTGFWVEKQVYSQIDSTGEYHVPSYHHGQLLYVIAEGFYEKSKLVGFWKEYWMELDSTRHYQRGTIKSLIEYKNGVPDGLFFEFYPNGNLRAMGTNESYPVNQESKTFSIPADYDSKELKLKDTTIYITHRSRIAGNGFYFAETGTSLLKFRKLNAD